MAESLITQKTMKLLKSFELAGEPIYFNKISDRFTSGIPDIVGVYYSVPFYIELKDAGEKARKLQVWHLNKARGAGAHVLDTDNYDEVVEFMSLIKIYNSRGVL